MAEETSAALLSRARAAMSWSDTAEATAAVALAAPGRDRVVCRRVYGEALLLAGDRLAARRVYAEALDEVREALGEDDVEALLLHNGIGITAKITGEVDLAAHHYGRALEILDARGGGDQLLAGLHHNLGCLAHTRGDMAQAERHTRKALALHEGGDEVGACADRGQLGSILSERFRPAVALLYGNTQEDQRHGGHLATRVHTVIRTNDLSVEEPERRLGRVPSRRFQGTQHWRWIMSKEVLVYAQDLRRAREEVTAVGGRVPHVLTEHLLVVALPDDVSVVSLGSVVLATPERLEDTDRLIAESWISRLGAESVPADRLARAASQPSIPWDTPGRTPPHGSLDLDNAPSGTVTMESTGTPTSLTLTGSVSVGVVMVSGPSDAWMTVQGALKYVSVASDGTVWGVSASDKIYRRTGNAWTQVPGALKQLSVGNASTAWGVSSADRIYFGSPPGLQLSVAEKGIIRAEVLEGLAFLASADPSANVSFVYDWQDVAVNAEPGADSGEDHRKEDFEATWRNAALNSMGYAPSRLGSRDYVDTLRSSNQTDWAYAAYFTKYPLGHFAYAGGERCVMHYNNDGWGPASINQVFAHETCHIFGAADEYAASKCGCGPSGVSKTPNLNCGDCTATQVPCLMNGNTLSLCPWSRAQIGWSLWWHIAGSLKYVSVASDGTVWGVSASNNIYRRTGNVWTQVSGALKQLSVGDASMAWGVNASDDIYRWDGNGWTQVAGSLKHVSVASDGTVWGVNASNNIYRRTDNAWTEVPGALKQLDAGSTDVVWGVSSSDNIFRLG